MSFDKNSGLFEAMAADIERAKRENEVWVKFFDVILGLNADGDRLEAYKRAQRTIEREENFDAGQSISY